MPWLTIIWLRFGLLLTGLLLLPLSVCGSCWPGGSAACARVGDLDWWCDDRRWWPICCCRKSVDVKVNYGISFQAYYTAGTAISLQFGVVARSSLDDERSECSPMPPPRLVLLLTELPMLQLLPRLLLDSVPWLAKSPLPFPVQLTTPCPPLE